MRQQITGVGKSWEVQCHKAITQSTVLGLNDSELSPVGQEFGIGMRCHTSLERAMILI